MTTFTLTTANIRGLPLEPKRFVRRRMRKALLHPGAVMPQEVARYNMWTKRPKDDYNDLWRQVAANHGKKTYGGPHEVPVSVPEAWQVDGHDSELVVHGKALVSPDRYITTVKGVVGGDKIAEVNCHPPSKPRKGVPFSAWRIKNWDAYVARLSEIVTELHTEGYTVFFGGDMNKVFMPLVVRGEILLIQSGLDHLWCLPAKGVHVVVEHREKVASTARFDHPILTVTVSLEKAAA